MYAFVLINISIDSKNPNYSEQWENYFIVHSSHFWGILFCLRKFFMLSLKGIAT